MQRQLTKADLLQKVFSTIERVISDLLSIFELLQKNSTKNTYVTKNVDQVNLTLKRKILNICDKILELNQFLNHLLLKQDSKNVQQDTSVPIDVNPAASKMECIENILALYSDKK